MLRPQSIKSLRHVSGILQKHRRPRNHVERFFNHYRIAATWTSHCALIWNNKTVLGDKVRNELAHRRKYSAIERQSARACEFRRMIRLEDKAYETAPRTREARIDRRRDSEQAHCFVRRNLDPDRIIPNSLAVDGRIHYTVECNHNRIGKNEFRGPRERIGISAFERREVALRKLIILQDNLCAIGEIPESGRNNDCRVARHEQAIRPSGWTDKRFTMNEPGNQRKEECKQNPRLHTSYSRLYLISGKRNFLK